MEILIIVQYLNKKFDKELHKGKQFIFGVSNKDNEKFSIKNWDISTMLDELIVLTYIWALANESSFFRVSLFC